MEFYTGIHQPQIVEDEYGPVIDEDEDYDLCDESMEVNENRRTDDEGVNDESMEANTISG